MAQLARGDTAGQQVKNMLKVSLPCAALLLPLCLTWAFPKGWAGADVGHVGNSWQQKPKELGTELFASRSKSARFHFMFPPQTS